MAREAVDTVRVVAFAGGVGGAKLALGLSKVLSPNELSVVVNTGDDESFYGLHVSPDLDTVMYTLAGLSNPESGWGLAGDTFNALGMLRNYGIDTWFNLGDQDLATHIRRTQLLQQGATLSEVTLELCRRLGVQHTILPMSDQPVRTILSTDAGELPMQQYFVQHRSEPRVCGVRYAGASDAKPAPGLLDVMSQATMAVFCPSNPHLSLGPILAVPGIKQALETFSGVRVAVSPIVGGAALRGPAGKIMSELGLEVSSVGVARQYQGLLDVFAIDHKDAGLASEITSLGIEPMVTSIIMDTEIDKVELAQRILALGGG